MKIWNPQKFHAIQYTCVLYLVLGDVDRSVEVNPVYSLWARRCGEGSLVRVVTTVYSPVYQGEQAKVVQATLTLYVCTTDKHITTVTTVKHEIFACM